MSTARLPDSWMVSMGLRNLLSGGKSSRSMKLFCVLLLLQNDGRIELTVRESIQINSVDC